MSSLLPGTRNGAGRQRRRRRTARPATPPPSLSGQHLRAAVGSRCTAVPLSSRWAVVSLGVRREEVHTAQVAEDELGLPRTVRASNPSDPLNRLVGLFYHLRVVEHRGGVLSEGCRGSSRVGRLFGRTSSAGGSVGRAQAGRRMVENIRLVDSIHRHSRPHSLGARKALRAARGCDSGDGGINGSSRRWRPKPRIRSMGCPRRHDVAPVGTRGRPRALEVSSGVDQGREGGGRRHRETARWPALGVVAVASSGPLRGQRPECGARERRSAGRVEPVTSGRSSRRSRCRMNGSASSWVESGRRPHCWLDPARPVDLYPPI